MADYRLILENDYPGDYEFTRSCLEPVFGPIQRAKRSLNDDISDVDKTIIKNIFIFGSSNNFSFGEMNFFDVTLHDKVDIARSRVTIQRAVRKSIDSYQAAIVIFHYENNTSAGGQSRLWRFSFINKGDGAKNTTPAKRYSYLCGKGYSCRTAADNLETLANIQGKKKLEDVTAVFSIEALTKEFFKRLFKWYDDWALTVVRYPVGSGKNARLPKTALDEAAKKENRQHLIRLITRLIFVWFLKHKENLIPSWIFDVEELKKIINDFDQHSAKNGSYYNAVLQNLFFATLNCEIHEREFFDGKDGRNSYGIKSKYRDHIDKPMLKISHAEFIKKMRSIPFLNGGLFECLDRRDEHKEQEYKDGFSRESARSALVPNCLFFGDGEHEGLLEIFSQYNFTIEENTPHDIEVALDPELLGKVFENLLGTYNEETSATARKESGSFYTPREIVDYMVDTSLKEYFKEKLKGGSLPLATKPTAFSLPPLRGAGGGFDYRVIRSYRAQVCTADLGTALPPATPPDALAETELEEKLNKLFSYHEAGHDFDAGQVKLLMGAINNCKILDPACGSGAFPMGILNKLTFILGKLDPENKQWQELQRKKAIADTEDAFTIGDRQQREDRLKEISGVFEFNSGNYGRKLYLIENCIHGVDIQPVAIQISKLRFFISLIVDQKTGGTIDNNYNILPLPNLETKFVAANTLIGIKREQGVFADSRIEETQKELLEVRHKHFRPRTVKEKDKLRKRDIELTHELLDLLKKDGFYNSSDAAQMAKWNPYSQTEASDFFDSWWMFGIQDGFDVVIGNPPYVSTRNLDSLLKDKYKENYELAVGQFDIFILFIEKANQLLNTKGILSFIIPKKILTNENFISVRRFIIKNLPVKIYLDAQMPFETASVEVNVIISTRENIERINTYILDGNNIEPKFSVNTELIAIMPFNIFPFAINPSNIMIINSIQKQVNHKLDDYLDIIRGLECGFNHSSISHIKGKYKIIKGEHIKKYVIKETDWYVNPNFSDTKVFKPKSIFLNHPKLVTKFVSNTIDFALDEIGYFNTNVVYNIHPKKGNEKLLKFFLALCNSKLVNFLFFNTYTNDDKLFPHIQKNQLGSIPVIIPEKIDIYDKLVCQILEIKSKDTDANISALERQINNLVYRLYNLIYDEVKVIEPGFPLSRAAYEGMGVQKCITH